MVSFEVRQAVKKMGRIIMLTAVAGPFTCFSQLALESAADRHRQIVERIEQEQSQDGIHSPDLIGPLTALALLYQEEGDHGLAVAAFERARQVIRVNYGFSSLEEAPLLRQLVRAEEARGNVEAAWDLEQELLTLARRHPDDLRTVPIFREIADKRMDTLKRYRAGEFLPQVTLGCYYRAPNNNSCTSGSRTQMMGAIYFQAQRYRAAAIQTILRNGLYASDELRELEMESLRAGGRGFRYHCPGMQLQELLETEFVGSCLEPVTSYGGLASLVRLLIYEVRSSAPVLSQVDALVRLADYNLWLSRGLSAYESTLALYEHAYRQLKENGIAQASIGKIFSPETPVVLPALLPNPLASEEISESIGYIDVAFDITKYGKSKQIEILDTTTNATRAAKKNLVHLIRHSRFRPRVTDGQFTDTSRVVVRHYLND